MLGLAAVILTAPSTKKEWTIIGAWIADAALLGFAWWTRNHHT